MTIWSAKMRGVIAEQDGTQVPGTGRVAVLNFRGQLTEYDAATGTLSVGPSANTTRSEVHAATTAALAANTRSGNTLTASANGALAAIDGVTLTTNQRVLVKNEATTANNGWYFVADPGSASTPWQLTRTADADASAEIANGAASKVLSGTANAGKYFQALTVGGTFTLNTDPITFIEYFPVSATWKEPVRVATAAALATNSRAGNILTASSNGALAAVDGVSLVVGDRLLVKDEATGANNGIYQVTSLGSGGTPWVLTRAPDLSQAAQAVAGIRLFATEGTVNADRDFALTTNNPITLNTTALTFATIQLIAPGATTQLLYNNAGVIDGASGITVVGSETGLSLTYIQASAGTIPTNGLVRGANNAAVAVAANAAGGSILLGYVNDTDTLYIGRAVGAFVSPDDAEYHVRTSGTHTFAVNGTAEFILSASTLDCNQNSITDVAHIELGTGTLATAGHLRFPQVATIQFRNNANSTNLNVLRLGSTTDDIWFGDTPSGCDMTIFAATTVTFAPGGSGEYTMTATALDLADNNLTNVGDFDHDGTNLGFYGTAPIAKQTGVAVTAGGIHTALVNLGLIAA